MCDRCEQFSKTEIIETTDQLQSLHGRLFFEGKDVGVLEVMDGSLQWSDHIECTMRCICCQQQFTLDCETYHGMGGWFGPAA